MDIKQLRYFLGVVEAKSLTKAAEALNIAQPAIGMQIRKLEDELGVRLLVRHSRGVVPTEAGTRLETHAKSLLREFDRARQDVADIGGEPRGRVAVGMTKAVMHVMASKLVATCRQKYPNLFLQIGEAMSRQLEGWMIGGRLDIVLTFNPPDDPDLVSEPVAEENMHLIAPVGHPLAGSSGVRLHELLSYDFILTSRQVSYFRVLLEETAKSRGVDVHVVCEADSVASTVELVRGGLGCAAMPVGAVRAEIDAGQIIALPIIEPPIRRVLNLTYLKKSVSSKALDTVCEEIRRIVSETIESGTAGWFAPSGGKTPHYPTAPR